MTEAIKRIHQVRDDYQAAKDAGLCLVLICDNGRTMLVEYIGPNYVFVSERDGYTEKIFHNRLQTEFNDDRFWVTISMDKVNALPPDNRTRELAKQIRSGGYIAASVPDARDPAGPSLFQGESE
jgi:hypothetical protein